MSSKLFSKLLIANRGEIACRIMKTAKALGIHCIAVYSEADAQALHVQMADEAYLLGPAPSKESYLSMATLLEIAKRSGAQAIHPGYGFLSENADFAKACQDAGLIFVGPSPSAIAAMGSKSAAKAIMSQANVPLVPGYHGANQDIAFLKRQADSLGYPLLLKAAFGGGGKGMKVVWQQSEFEEQLLSAKREALNGFGNDQILLERYLTKPRHVEIQVFADSHQNTVYLAERDCSIQRRHQKVLEEAPAPNLSASLRQAMGEAAVKAAKAIHYQGAGTVEFLLDSDGSFYFMEMNTRLQVEHPVTELITGQDLVKWQLLVAAGQPLPLRQEDIQIHGHALEVRVYAEDPAHDFLPATGRLTYLSEPAQTRHVRLDTGVVEGDEISPFYDPMIAKLIVWDETRDLAIQRLVRALSEYRIAGVKTNVHFLKKIAKHPAFHDALLETQFIEKHQESLLAQEALPLEAALFAALYLQLKEQAHTKLAHKNKSPWQHVCGWQLNAKASVLWKLQHGETVFDVHLSPNACPKEPQQFTAHIGPQHFCFEATLDQDKLSLTLNHKQFHVHAFAQEHSVTVFTEDGTFVFSDISKQELTFQSASPEGGLSAPMNGTVSAVLVSEGCKVEAGQTLLVIEAMKMEYAIKAPAAGYIRALYYQAGDLVKDGQALVAFEPCDLETGHSPHGL